jgi:hypothetical protein
MLRPPTLLEELLAAGRWPRTVEEQLRQNLSQPLVPAERVRKLAPEESEIFLLAPPFRTVRDYASSDSRRYRADWWSDPIAAPTEIDFDLALDIGDFGPGTDAPILLDYRASPEAPRVIRLRWSLGAGGNHWVTMAPDFEAFVRELGL